jgi:hypothetical protein
MGKKFNSSGFILAFIAALKVLNFFKIDSQKRERKKLETQIKIFENFGKNRQIFLEKKLRLQLYYNKLNFFLTIYV